MWIIHFFSTNTKFLLFIIYLNDLASATDLFKLIIYAEDTALSATLSTFGNVDQNLENLIKQTSENRKEKSNYEYEKIKIENNVSFYDYLNGLEIDVTKEGGRVDKQIMEIFNYKLRSVTNQYNAELKKLLNENKKLFVAFIDFKKAFDTVNHQPSCLI